MGARRRWRSAGPRSDEARRRAELVGLMEAHSPRLRLSIIAVVVISLFGALFARMWYLQVMVANRYQLQASADRVRTVQIEAPRGLIYDDKHRVLVENRTSLVVTMDPSALDKLTHRQTDDLELRVATELTSSGVPTKVAAIKQALIDKNVNHLQPIPIAVDVPDDVELYFAERAPSSPRWRSSASRFASTRTDRWPPTCSATSAASTTPSSWPSRAAHPHAQGGQAVPGRQRDRQDRGRGGLRGLPAGHARHREDRGRRAEQPGARAERDAADPRRRPRADHRHRRAALGRDGAGPGARRAAGARPRAATVLKAPGRIGGGDQPEQRRGRRHGHLPDLQPGRLRQRHLERRVRPAHPERRRQQPAHQPGHAGPVRAGLDLQAHHRHRGAPARPDHGLDRRSTTRAAFHIPNCTGDTAAASRATPGARCSATCRCPEALTRSSDAFFYQLGYDFYVQLGPVRPVRAARHRA